ncbi:MAG: hypothetical protein H0V63_05480, partial [Burkholderiaceae bacterium]|nr:hypothetical protein [Burkholderiaceae bacterium]
TGPYVVIDTAVFRKACALDPREGLLFAPTPLTATRFDTRDDALAAIQTTCKLRGWDPAAYLILPLVEWEEEHFAPRGRRKQRARGGASTSPDRGDPT